MAEGSRRSHARVVAEHAAFVVLYVALDWVSYLQPIESAGTTPWNPPPGLSLVAYLRRGWIFAPTVFLSALSSDLFVRGDATTVERAVASSALFALGYGVLGAWIRRRCGGEPDFRRVADVSWFAGVVSAAVIVIGAAYVLLVHYVGPMPAVSLGRQWLQFWVGDVIGILVFTPALCVRGSTRSPSRLNGIEVVAQIGSTATVLALLWMFNPDRAVSLFYLLFLPLVWITIRGSIAGATLALAAIQLGLIAGLQLAGHTQEMVLELQLLMLTLVFTGLLLGASVSEWRSTEHSLRERQAELDESLKLASASATASALAHELNQPLSAIASYVGAAKAMLVDVENNRDRLEGALLAAGREAARAGEVIRRLREFFRSGAKHLERVKVSQLIEDSIEGLADSIRQQRITVRIDCPEDVGLVCVDRVQLESVIHQLLQNAVDSIVGADVANRSIEIRARRERDAVLIAVSDSGPGIDPNLGDAIFSPFKTTKPLGTGLGLSISRTIVEDHGGSLSCSSSAGGASFQLLLPSANLQEGNEIS